MEIFESTIVYILAPAKSHSGGPELLHQLASCLRRRGIDARMCYVPMDELDPVHEVLKKYHIPVTHEIQDRPENILIVPEIGTEYLFLGEQIRRIIWWMSVDNYVKNICYLMNVYRMQESFSSNKLPMFFYFQENEPIIHWVQSEYARSFVQMHGVVSKQISFVGDYLRCGFLQQKYDVAFADKENWILYNPAKGYEFTFRLMQAAPDLSWVPIKNMTPEEVHGLLSLGKVYVDFGAHPGRDRIPREAAISGCCVVTSRRGAAANDVDVPIPSEYKFEDRTENIPAIIQKIRFLLEHYESETKKFDNYRQEILREPEKFAEDVARALEYETDPAIKTALLCPTGIVYEKSFFQVLSDMEEYHLVFLVTEQEGVLINAPSDFPCISVEDAGFLYQEKRFDKLLIEDSLLSGEECEHVFRILDIMQIRQEDCLLANSIAE